MKTNCALCNASFECGAAGGNYVFCWCEKKPKVPLLKNISSCFCESCFSKHQEKKGVLTCFRMLVAYVGSDFSGFQEQRGERTVAGELKCAIAKLAKDAKIAVAGRTDAGVHARGQVISVELFTRLSSKQFTLALLSLLPNDLSVWRVDKMPLLFDARRQSIGKRYVYRIFQGLVPDPFSKNSLHVRQILDVHAMSEASSLFVGEHDFESFRAVHCTAAHARRFVWHASVKKRDATIEIDIRGNAFCMNMVRIMVGTLVEVGRGKRQAADIGYLLKHRDRKAAGSTAKAHGLTLEKVFYPDELDDALIPADAHFPRYPVTKESWPFDSKEILYGPTL